MTPIELVESDDDDRKGRGESTFERSQTPSAGSGTAGTKELYGEPQHERSSGRAETRAAYYGEPQHEELDEFLGGEPFPWLLDASEDEEETQPPTCIGSGLPLKRLRNKRTSSRR